MISNLKDILLPASNQGYAVACFNVFGFEDSKAVIDAAEARNASVILSINLGYASVYVYGANYWNAKTYG